MNKNYFKNYNWISKFYSKVWSRSIKINQLEINKILKLLIKKNVLKIDTADDYLKEKKNF